QFDDLRDSLLEKGYCVVWFDFPGTGKSTGKFEDTTLIRQRNTLNEVIKYVYKLKGVNKDDIALLAMSFATVSAITLDTKMIKTYILASTNGDPYKVISNLFKFSFNRKIFRNVFNPAGVSIRTNAVGDVLKLKPSFWESLKDINIKKYIEKMSAPKMYLHGDRDKTASFSEAKKMYRLTCNPKKFVTVKGAGHNYDESKKVRQDMIKAVLNWLEETL
ncbi:alpha/beta hydrolase, partial [bacterium]|nr:alpha/beta hydrolase [bacterium]